MEPTGQTKLLPELLTRYMARAHIAVPELAKTIEVARTTVDRWLSGEMLPKQGKIEACARALSASAEELLAAADKDRKSKKSMRFYERNYAIRIPSKVFLPEDEALVPVVPPRPIMHPCQFFGRDVLLKRILQAWDKTFLEHVLITGPKGSGKTSLLHYLKEIHRVSASSLRPDQQVYGVKKTCRWILADFGEIQTPGQFVQYVLRDLDFHEVEAPAEHGLEMLRDRLENGGPVVILMDNVEAGLRADGLDARFWNWMRSAGTHCPNVGFCGTTRRSAPELTVYAEQLDKSSPFVNAFQEYRLTPLSEEEAGELIACFSKSLEKTHSALREEDRAWIVKESGQWPVLLQILCQLRLDTLDEGMIGDAWREAAPEKMRLYKDLR
ncbi:MAG: ATP-binding protein [Gammaproteobacteria bacterium]|nr:ATP-binding protein [Gammaproteobacteria bacterium]